MRMRIMQKIENGKIKSHTHIKHKICFGKLFWEKTQLEGEVTPLSFSIWKYGCKYKEVWFVACGLIQCTNALYVLYLQSFLAIFDQLWNKCTRKNGMSLPSSGPVITQPDSLLVVKFDYLNS